MIRDAAPGTAAGRIVAFSYMLTLALAYGLMFSLNRIATTEGIPFIPYVFWQIVVAAIALWLVCGVRRRWPAYDRSSLMSYLMVGLFGFAIPYSVLAAAAPRAPASVISLTLTLTPVLVYAFAAMLRMERLYRLRMVGIACSLGGVLLALLPQASLPSPEMVPWVALAFAAPLCYAIANLSAAHFRPAEGSPVQLGAGVLAGAALLMLPVMAVEGSWWFFDGPMTPGDWTVFGAAAINALFMILMYEVLRLAGPVVFSTYSYIATLCGMGWAALIFAELPSAWIWASLVLLFLGLYLVNRQQRAAPVKEVA